MLFSEHANVHAFVIVARSSLNRVTIISCIATAQAPNRDKELEVFLRCHVRVYICTYSYLYLYMDTLRLLMGA